LLRKKRDHGSVPGLILSSRVRSAARSRDRPISAASARPLRHVDRSWHPALLRLKIKRTTDGRPTVARCIAREPIAALRLPPAARRARRAAATFIIMAETAAGRKSAAFRRSRGHRPRYDRAAPRNAPAERSRHRRAHRVGSRRRTGNRRSPRVSFALRALRLLCAHELVERGANNVRVRVIGNGNRFARRRVGACRSASTDGGPLPARANLAVNYSSRAELEVRCVRSRATRQGLLAPESVDEALIGRYLHTTDLPESIS